MGWMFSLALSHCSCPWLNFLIGSVGGRLIWKWPCLKMVQNLGCSCSKYEIKPPLEMQNVMFELSLNYWQYLGFSAFQKNILSDDYSHGVGSIHHTKFSTQAAAEGEGRCRVKSLPSSSLERILLSNQHAALHGDSIGTPLAVARIPHNQEAGRGLVGGVGC